MSSSLSKVHSLRQLMSHEAGGILGDQMMPNGGDRTNTFKNRQKVFHCPRSSGASEWASKRMSEQSGARERMSEWPITNVPISKSESLHADSISKIHTQEDSADYSFSSWEIASPLLPWWYHLHFIINVQLERTRVKGITSVCFQLDEL